MRHPPLIFALWPGLPGLVRHGRWSFLAIALGFGFVAASVLFVCGYWSEIISAEAKRWLYGATGGVWLFFSFLAGELSVFFDRRLLFDARGDQFLELLGPYLAGNWHEAEKAARSMLKHNGKDPETLLLLSTLCRHTGRFSEATESLAQLKRLENAARWSHEIALEEAALLRERSEKRTEPGSDDEESENSEESVSAELSEPVSVTSEMPQESLLPFNPPETDDDETDQENDDAHDSYTSGRRRRLI